MALFQPQGTLNKLLGSVQVIGIPGLNITPGFLSRNGIRWAFEGDATETKDTMTGIVTSPQPYRIITATCIILKTNGLAALWKAQEEISSLIGDCALVPDTTALPPYPMLNASILGVDALTADVSDVGYPLRLRGYYPINVSFYTNS